MSQEHTRTRIEALDWLRGLMALSIMTYHLSSWLFFALDSSSVLGRFGIYGVSVFFVLSGLSIALVYSTYLQNMKTSVFFFVRRIFRIWPLLWICIALIVVKTGRVDVSQIVLNMTTLFGFIAPGDYINTGAWSIGNEMVYYALTPIFIMAYNKRLSYGNLCTLAAFALTCVYAFYLLRPEDTLANQWHSYINPFNNLFLYASGIALFYNLRHVRIKPGVNALIFLASACLFVLYPATGNQIHIVTGINRIVFVATSIFLVLSFYKFTSYHSVPKYIQVPLLKLGAATYGVYLLHPVVWLYAKYLLTLMGFSNTLLIFVTVFVLTILFALLSYEYYEKRLIHLGKQVTRSDRLAPPSVLST